MTARIKNYEVDDAGIEFEIRSPNGQRHRGDLFLTKTGLIWCQGKTRRPQGQEIRWADFIKWAQDRSKK